MNQIIYNAIRTPDGTVLESKHQHDYREYVDQNGKTYMVDGGLSYLRRNGSPSEDYQELSVYQDDPHEKVREVLRWGTRGPDGDQPLKYVLLKDMSTDHIQAILDTQYHISDWRREVYEAELNHRKKE